MLHPSFFSANLHSHPPLSFLPPIGIHYWYLLSIILSAASRIWPACQIQTSKCPYLHLIVILMLYTMLFSSPSSQREGKKEVGSENGQGNNIDALSSHLHTVLQPTIHFTSIWSRGRAANALVWCLAQAWMLSQNHYVREETYLFSTVIFPANSRIWSVRR